MEYLLPLALLAISAGWVYSDAKERGSNSAAGWAIGVVLLWIVFFPLYLFARPTKHNNQAIASAPLPVLCNHCGKYFPGPGVFCPLCGKSLKADGIQ